MAIGQSRRAEGAPVLFLALAVGDGTSQHKHQGKSSVNYGRRRNGRGDISHLAPLCLGGKGDNVSAQVCDDTSGGAVENVCSQRGRNVRGAFLCAGYLGGAVAKHVPSRYVPVYTVSPFVGKIGGERNAVALRVRAVGQVYPLKKAFAKGSYLLSFEKFCCKNDFFALWLLALLEGESRKAYGGSVCRKKLFNSLASKGVDRRKGQGGIAVGDKGEIPQIPGI